MKNQLDSNVICLEVIIGIGRKKLRVAKETHIIFAPIIENRSAFINSSISLKTYVSKINLSKVQVHIKYYFTNNFFENLKL